MERCPLLNFKWHLPNQLATSGKPSYPGQLDWIVGQGFKAIVSLEAIPDLITNQIVEKGIHHLHFDTDDSSFDPDDRGYRKIKQAREQDERQIVRYMGNIIELPIDDWMSLTFFVNRMIESGNPVLIHCSAGIKRSMRLAQMYLRQQLRLTGWLLPKATMYRYGDPGKKSSFAIDTGGIIYAISDTARIIEANEAGKSLVSSNDPYPPDKYSNCRIYVEESANCLFRHQMQIGNERWDISTGSNQVGLYLKRDTHVVSDELHSLWVLARDLEGLGCHIIVLSEIDNHDILLAHQSLDGERMTQALELISVALESGKKDYSDCAVKVVVNLWKHRTHGCMDEASFCRLQELYEQVEPRIADLQEQSQAPSPAELDILRQQEEEHDPYPGGHTNMGQHI